MSGVPRDWWLEDVVSAVESVGLTDVVVIEKKPAHRRTL